MGQSVTIHLETDIHARVNEIRKLKGIRHTDLIREMLDLYEKTNLISTNEDVNVINHEKEKTCTKCKNVFPATNDFFQYQNRKLKTLRANCKKCVAEYNKQRPSRKKLDFNDEIKKYL